MPKDSLNVQATSLRVPSTDTVTFKRPLKFAYGVGSGTGWGVISARALVAQKPQMRVVESKPPSKSGMSWLKQKSQQEVGRTWGHRGRRRIRTTHDSGRMPHSVVSVPNNASPDTPSSKRLCIPWRSRMSSYPQQSRHEPYHGRRSVDSASALRSDRTGQRRTQGRGEHGPPSRRCAAVQMACSRNSPKAVTVEGRAMCQGQ